MSVSMDQAIRRRKFVKGLVAGATALAAWPALASPMMAATAPVLKSGFQFLAKPYLQNLTPQSVVIHCILPRQAAVWVDFRILNGPWQKAQSSKDGFFLIDGKQAIGLAGLQPAAQYQYRVVAREIISFEPYKLVYGQELSSELFEFKTPAIQPNTVSCLILNDIHDRPESFETLIQLAQKKEYESVILNGDMFNHMSDESQVINHLLAPCAKVFSSTKPFYFLRGNHETRGVFSRDINPYFSFPDDQYYFTTRWGPVQFIFLDTGEDKPDDAPVYANIVDFDRYRVQQAQWLQDLAKTKRFKKAPFRVVVMHIPPHHSGDWHGTLHCRKWFHPIFEKYKIDMVISGHTHKYGVHPPQADHNYPIIIGGGPQNNRRTLIHLSANQKALEISMVRDDGTQVGSYTVNKKS